VESPSQSLGRESGPRRELRELFAADRLSSGIVIPLHRLDGKRSFPENTSGGQIYKPKLTNRWPGGSGEYTERLSCQARLFAGHFIRRLGASGEDFLTGSLLRILFTCSRSTAKSGNHGTVRELCLTIPADSSVIPTSSWPNEFLHDRSHSREHETQITETRSPGPQKHHFSC
jgi:hypothetical protein